ncbi:MAG: methionine--tRNA ligase [Leptolyngbyaceae cyanobacterium SM1_1_3]|nr:methionine--tRNA ligase [Leptolyngbyaceae cyanobacterium SM1_1_3]NJN02090.1 methionine--tRNA ligase [Leptolyngbyaceae cyanobacterium RM1_1_2]NJO09698.1 methionine--tRNA ligase [Leptolyngbyaceae cyanobacterium SL_1_1]
MRYLITSALPYINGIKHLGNLVGSMLPADVYARFLRQQGQDVLYICGTDEHGTPAELAALEENLDVATYCKRQYERQADVYKRFGLSFDYFGRTSSAANHELTQQFYHQLDQNGFIEEQEISQIYSLEDNRFLPDRYVVGTCPKCGYENARGDQCENCTSVLSPTDLLDPRSAISGSTNLEVRTSKHLFLRLDQLSDEVRTWVEQQNNWPTLTKSIAMKWLNEGLQSRGITRDLSWGVPVPRAGFEDKVFYVWFDAPIGYVAATKAWAEQSEQRSWLDWWQNASDVHYVQFMAKDNLPFHTIMWPAMILGTQEPWKLADYIKGFNWLNYYGGKFSTSSKRGVFLDQALDVLPADYWRYTLMASAPESADSAFTWEQLQLKVNKELADNLGNFINRILKFASARFQGTVPAGGEPTEAEHQLEVTCRELMAKIAGHLQAMEFRKATEALNALWTAGNQYIDTRAPWALFKEDKDEAALVIRTCINLIRIYAIAAMPFIPFTAQTICDALKLSAAERTSSFEAAVDFSVMQPERSFDVPPPLFQKLDDDRIEALKAQFGGKS